MNPTGTSSLILDACRVDALREVADEYEFIEDVDSVWSVDSQSAEWIANTFTESWCNEIKETTYISGNGYGGAVLKGGNRPPAKNTIPINLSSWSTVDESVFNSHVEVWKTNHDEMYGTVHPKPITDYTIEEGRNGDANRIIAHYTRPHLQYIGIAYREGREATELESRGYELLEEGRGSTDEYTRRMWRRSGGYSTMPKNF